MLTDMSATRMAALCISVLATLAGCVVGPDYRPPSVSLSPLHNAALVDTRQPAAPAPALETWWDGFHDPLLSRMVQRALEQNLDLAAARARVAQARAQAREAGALLAPSGELSAQSASLHQSLDSPLGAIARNLPGYRRDQNLQDVGVGASWDLDVFGGLRRGAQAAGAQAQAVQAEQLGVRTMVAAEAADAYLQIRGAQARVQLAESQVSTDAQLLALVRLRLRSGVATEREVAQAEALVARARSSLPPLRMTQDAEMNRLDVLVGAQPGTVAAEMSVPMDIPSVPAIDGNRETAQILRRRPDVNAAERRLAAANARIGAAVAEYYPHISFSALLGFESLSADRLFTAASFQPVALAGLHWRLFDFGKVDAEVAAADAATAEALARYRQTLLRATEEIENSFMSLVQLEAQSRELTIEVLALTHARDTSQAAYLGGAIDLTDVLDADRELLVAQDEMARTRADAARSAVSSFKALGGGW
jgi:NodT family efflux transporter outer membrane factor (OMF) lipoprotein